MNENQVFKYNHTIKKNSLIKKESTISIKKENKNKIEYNIGENNQNRIFKINNLG